VETAAAVQIGQGSLRQYFLNRFPPPLEKACAKNAPAFSQLRTGPAAVNLSTHSTAAIHLKIDVFLSKEWGVPQNSSKGKLDK